MAIMPTGMHLTRKCARVFQTCRLVNWQRIHVSTQANHTTQRISTAFNYGYNTSFSNTCCDVSDAKFAQPFLNKFSSVMHIEPQLRMHMQMPPPSSNFSMSFGKSVLNRHIITLNLNNLIQTQPQIVENVIN